MSLSSGVSTVSILCCVALVCAVLPSIYAGQLFPWHPVLMGVGFLGFMCEGIVAAYRLRAVDGQARTLALQNHMWVQVASAVCILLGFWTIVYNKTLHHKQHFTSLHGKVGLLTVLLVAFTPIIGIFSFKSLGFSTLLPQDKLPSVKWLHRLLGATTWTLGIITMQLCLPHPAVMEGVLCWAWRAASCALAAAMLFLLRRPPSGKPLLPRTASVQDVVAAPVGVKHL